MPKGPEDRSGGDKKETTESDELQQVKEEVADWMEWEAGLWDNRPEEMHPHSGILSRKDYNFLNTGRNVNQLQNRRREEIVDESTEVAQMLKRLAKDTREGGNDKRISGFLRGKMGSRFSTEKMKERARYLLGRLDELKK